MKHLLYLFSVIAIACSFASCSNDENTDWMYGDKQELANTEWKSILTYYYDGTAPSGRADTKITQRAETLSFDANRFTLTDTRWDYTTEKEYTVQATGDNEYKHPKLNLIFDDGTVLEAAISARNTIYYSDEKMGHNEFERQ